MNNFIQNRKFRILIACISLLLLVDLVQDTYAKYISSANATSDFTIAKWSFLVNNQDIINNQDFTNTIIPTFDPNQNIKSGVIAPTSTGYFDVTIDSSNVGVSFTETITLSKNLENTVTDIVFTGYKKNNDAIVTINDEDTATITNTHLLGEERTENTYRFYIKWLDGTGETMNNAADTEATKTGMAKVDINIQFIQLANQNQNQNPEP